MCLCVCVCLCLCLCARARARVRARARARARARVRMCVLLLDVGVNPYIKEKTNTLGLGSRDKFVTLQNCMLEYMTTCGKIANTNVPG